MIDDADPSWIVHLGDHPHYFLDDHCVGGMSNLARHVQQPTKFDGNPVITCDHPWERVHMYRPSVIYEPQIDRFRMHYTTIDASQPKAFLATCFAESDDGFVWRKPVSDRFLYQGQPSNIVGGPAQAIRTPHDPRRPYIGVFNKVLVGDSFQGRGVAVSSSADGLDWGTPRRITETKCDTVPSIVWHAPAQRYFVYTRAQAYHPRLYGHLRMTGVMASADFENWTPKRAINLITESEGFPYVQAHALTAHACGDLLVGEVPVMHLEEPGNNFLARFEIQLATSRDGWHWQRVAGGAVFLPPGPAAWDRWYVHSTSMTRKGDTLYFYYNGRAQKHGAVRQLREQGVQVQMPGPDSMIGVATLPADRFLSVEPIDDAEPGTMDTPPVRFDGRELLVNADVNPAGLQVELVDEQGPVVQFQSKPVPGFEREHSRLVRLDDLRHRVLWTGNGGERHLGDAAGARPLVIRFRLRRGKLFAFQVTDGQ